MTQMRDQRPQPIVTLVNQGPLADLQGSGLVNGQRCESSAWARIQPSRSLLEIAPPMNRLDIVRMVVSPSPSHPFGLDVVGHDLAVIREWLRGRLHISRPARRSFGSAASASLLANGVRDIPWGGADLRCAEHQAEICVLSAPARDRSRRVIYGLGSIHSDGVSWECSSVTCIDLGSLAGNVAPSPAAGQNRRTVLACQASLCFWEVAQR